MGLQRIAISNPSANTDTKIFTAGDPYLLSIIATNKSASAGTISVWVQPNGASTESQYAFIVYNLPVDGNNSYETFRFAVNALDDVYIRSNTASVNFQAYGLAQYDIKLGAGVSSYSPNAPANPINGMIWVDSDGSVFGSSAKPIYIYNSSSNTWDSTAASAIDTSANHTWTGTNNFSASTSIGNISATEIDYLNNASANIQTQLNSKAPLASPTFTGTLSASVANISSNLTVDTNTLYVDSINNRVGIGTQTPNSSLEHSSGSWRLGTKSGGTYSGGLGGGFNDSNNIYSIYARDRTDTSWNTLWIETKDINIKTNGSNIAISADSSGRVTMSYQPAFIASHSSSYYGSTTGFTQYVWNSTFLNVGNHYNTSNGRFTAPVSGKYFLFFNARLDSAPAGSYLRVYINKNGTTGWMAPNLHSISGGNHSTDYETLSVSGIMDLSAGDYIQSGGGRDGGASNLLCLESTFGGYLLG